jgi:hypothetical protein
MSDMAATSAIDRHTYPDPFLDMASTRLPKSIRKMQELCRTFAMTHPQIAPVVYRLAEYPITSIVYTGAEEARRQNKDVLETEIGILDRCIEWGLDYNSGGNCFVTVQFPFLRFYACAGCSGRYRGADIKQRRFDTNEFTGICPKCKGSRKFTPEDQYMKRAKGINVVRLPPELITIKYNPVTGKHFYFYDIPPATKEAVRRGDWDIIDDTPVGFLHCIIKNTKMRLQRVFHFKRPTLSGAEMQWGMPLVLPALKDAYLNQIYKSADEAIALEHTVPLRIMFPEATTQDPLARIALGSFKGFMDAGIKAWRRDKNAIITTPLPVGIKVVGGDATGYQTIQARQFVVEEIIGAMQVTKGFVMGGEQWSSASISHRILENSFMNYLRRLDQCLQWVATEVQSYLKLPHCQVAMKPFKKVDDIQLLQLIIQLAREKRVSWNEVLSRVELDAGDQIKQIERETDKYLQLMIQDLLGQAEAGAKGAVMQAAAESEAQGVQQVLADQVQAKQIGPGGGQQVGAGQPGGGQPQAGGPPEVEAEIVDAGEPSGGAAGSGKPGQGGGAPKQREAYVPAKTNVAVKMGPQIDAWARELLTMPPETMKATLKRMAKENPELGQAVAQRASQMQQEQAAGGAMDLDALMAAAKSPEDLANKLLLMDVRARMKALREIQARNPQLGLMIMKALAVANQKATGMAGGAGDTVDMRPMSEQKPMMRENKPV